MSEPTVREAIEAAIEVHTTAEPAAGATLATPAPAEPTLAAPSSTGSDAAAPPEKSAPSAATQTGAGAPVPAAAKPVRKQGDLFSPEPKALAPKPKADALPAAAAAELKAPASWKADLREKWKTLPPEVQAEVIRRERENDARLQESASLRRFAQQFKQVTDPYRAVIESEGANPLAAFHDYLKTAQLLRTGAPADKARMVAQLVQQFQIPLAALDSYLAAAIRGGGAVPQQQQPQQQVYTQPPYTNAPGPQQFRDPRLDEMLERQANQDRETIRSSMQSFAADPKNEFFDDVRGTMADVMDAAAKRGIVMNLADAYSRACQIEPEVKKVLDARAAQGSVGAAARTLAAARHAASSLPSAAAPPAHKNANAAPGTVRDAILNAIDSLQGAA
jgi:hypothetical protein